jgi:hypothetical protein
MRSTPLRLLAVVCFALLAPLAFGQAAKKADKKGSDDPLTTALRAADDERVAAILSGDAARMNAIFSDGLSYTHSNGDFDTKSTYVGKLASGSTKYSTYQYTDRKFTSLGPGIAMMNARVRIIGKSEASPELNVYLSVLAIFREEQGKWRFLAWQSARLPLPDAAAKK